jgi:hypothetical protein
MHRSSGAAPALDGRAVSEHANNRVAVGQQTDHTPVYSPLSPEEARTPAHARRIHHEVCVKCHWPREAYPALPWPMESLVGTTWRNIHCGTPARVVAHQQDRWGNPVLILRWELAWGSLAWGLGLWSHDRAGGRYVVEDWVRVDQLSVEEQLPWFGFYLGWRHAQISVDTEQLAACTRKGDRINRRSRMEDLARDQREAVAAEKQLRAFAERAGLHITAEMINAWRSMEPWQNS